ncbi:MAG: sugar transferase [Candidatus Parcubacteria bacterium]|nr:sugar transferase [Candidatus Parcubacteria bacterium]
MLVLAGLSAYYLRVGSFVTDIRPVIYTLTIRQFVSYIILVAVVWVIIFALAGLYRIERRKFSREFSKILLACSTGILAIIVAIFLKRELFSSRFIILAAWGFSILYVTLGRLLIYKIQKMLLKRGVGAKKNIIIGNHDITAVIIDHIRQNPVIGYQIIKIYPTFNEEIQNEILNLHADIEIDEIIVADPDLAKQITLDIITFTEAHHIVFKFSADIYQTKTTRLEIDTLAGLPIFTLQKTKLEGWGRIYKRLFDFICSLILIILISPILLITAIAIKVDSKGPVFFKRKDDGSPLLRMGQNGKPYRYFKFRSMYDKTDSLKNSEEMLELNLRKDSPLTKFKDDPRITRVGKFIRKFSIDELPELFLVFTGKMSLVGPRPHLPEEVAQYQGYHRRVMDIKPGITGLAQISGRSDLSFEEEIQLDTYYVENWSIWLDLQILLKTPKVVLFPKRQAL